MKTCAGCGKELAWWQRKTTCQEDQCTFTVCRACVTKEGNGKYFFLCDGCEEEYCAIHKEQKDHACANHNEIGAAQESVGETDEKETTEQERNDSEHQPLN